MSYIRVRDLSYSYPGSQTVEALERISFEVAEHEFVSIIGPSGCGKSTLLRLIADLLVPTSGEVQIDSEPAQSARQKRDIGFVFQEPALMPWRSSLKNVRLPLEILKSGRRDGSIERDLLELVGLTEFQYKRPDQLSGGMRQRVSIARALTYNPRLLLMDEPFGSLDQLTRDEMNQELLKIWENLKGSVIFVTHSIAEAIFLSDTVIVMSPRPGRIVDTVRVPLARPRRVDVRRTAEFFECETRVLAALEGRLADV